MLSADVDGDLGVLMTLANHNSPSNPRETLKRIRERAVTQKIDAWFDMSLKARMTRRAKQAYIDKTNNSTRSEMRNPCSGEMVKRIQQ
jgi:hypothetical protein